LNLLTNCLNLYVCLMVCRPPLLFNKDFKACYKLFKIRRLFICYLPWWHFVHQSRL